MTETAMIVVCVVAVAAMASAVALGVVIGRMAKDYFRFADENADRWARSHHDLTDKLLSHSDDFLDMKRIDGENHVPARNAGRPAVVNDDIPTHVAELRPPGVYAEQGID